MKAIVTYTCGIVNVYTGSSNTRLDYMWQKIQINATSHDLGGGNYNSYSSFKEHRLNSTHQLELASSAKCLNCDDDVEVFKTTVWKLQWGENW